MQGRNISEGLEHMTDEEVVKLYQDGVQDTFGELSVRYICVIRNKSADFYDMGIEAEDLIQEGLIALHAAAVSYSARKGASFKTYATVCIRNRLASAVRSANNAKNRINNTAVSLEEQPGSTADLLSEPECCLIATENVREITEYARGKLSITERRVLSLYIDGRTYEEIAKELGISIKACDNAMQRVRRKLRDHISNV